MQKTIFTRAFFLLLILVYSACTVNETGPGKGKPLEFTLAQAQADFETHATDLQPVEYLFSKMPTKSFSQENLVPDWKKAIASGSDRFELYMIPLTPVSEIKAMLTYVRGRKKVMTGDEVKVASHLVIQRFIKTHQIRRFITTVVGFEAEPQKGNNPYLYMGDRRNFEGFLLISTESGKCTEAYYYTEGKRFKMHIPDRAPTQTEKEENALLQSSVGFVFFNKSISTKGSGGYVTGEDDGSYCYNCHQFVNFFSGSCSNCGAKPEEIGGGNLYFFCAKCGQLEKYCVCTPGDENDFACPRCGKEPCECDDETSCPYCRNRSCSGECRDIEEGDKGGNGEDPPVDLPAFTISVTPDGGGSCTGAGTYRKGNTITLGATPVSGSIFGGWSGDYAGRANPASLTVDKDYNITAHFYPLTSECGKLAKSISNYTRLQKYREKISGNGIEYGYIKSPADIREVTGTEVGKIKLPSLQNMTEMVHTHELEIHLSQGDLASLYRRFMRGDITDYPNFTYTVVSPDYFVVLQIADTSRMNVLIKDSMILKKSETTERYTLSDDLIDKYIDFIPNQSGKTIEDYFGDFVCFMNDLNSGLAISLHKKMDTTGAIASKFITDTASLRKLLKEKEVCKK